MCGGGGVCRCMWVGEVVSGWSKSLSYKEAVIFKRKGLLIRIYM